MSEAHPKSPRAAKRKTLASSEPVAPWYISEWLKHTDKKQADIIRELDWDKGRVSKLISGRQTYTGADLSALATWLEIEPHELLMKPSDAESLRRLRQVAVQIVKGLRS